MQYIMFIFWSLFFLFFFLSGLLSRGHFINSTKRNEMDLVVLDDLMSQCSNDQGVADLFTRGSHHRGISVLYLTQNLFLLGK